MPCDACEGSRRSRSSGWRLQKPRSSAVFSSTERPALRDQALPLFLYNTGARVQEFADLRVEHRDWGPALCPLHGKGDKRRVCLWPATVGLLKRFLQPP